MTLWYLVAAALLLVANGFFVGAEFALTAARRSRLEDLAANGDGASRTALLCIKELSLSLAGAQLGITIASLLLGFIAEPSVAVLIEDALHPLGLSETVLHSISFSIALVVVVFLHMVVGEMAPKNMVIARPDESARLLAPSFRIFVNLFRPFIRALNAIANGILRLCGVEPQDELGESHSAEDISSLISESAREGLLGQVEHRLLSGAIGFGDKDAVDVMVPRTEVNALPAESTPADAERVMLETGHSRLPVFASDIDHVLGFVHAKDLLRVDVAARDDVLERRLIRPMLVVPESRRLHALLFDMRRERRHFALVIDEHGGTSGIVTIEDLLEELVGEIRDEYDASELGIEQLSDHRFVVPGSLRIDEVADYVGLELPEGDYETVAGFVIDRLGRIPRRRDSVRHTGWRLRVRSMQRRRVVQVLIEPATEPGEAEPEGAGVAPGGSLGT
ncbi:MAG: hemolysin family protein [Actinomycetota bacterium]|nr:hemolysin family protein [Actinomycetota bacterium]